MTTPALIAQFLSTSKGHIMQAATLSVFENKMEPIAKAPVTQQVVVTGQGLYNAFVVDDQTNIYRMDQIRALVETADALQIKGATDAMVELARKVDYPEGKPKKADRGNKEQQAMNVRTIIQQAWGALKHARPQLEAIGYTDTTGYQAMRVMAKKALDVSGKTWQGFDVPSEADKAAAALKRKNAGETKALVEVQKDNPRGPGESLAEWNTRVFAIAEEVMEQARETADDEVAEKEIARILEKFGPNVAARVIVGLLNKLDTEVVEEITFATMETLGIEYQHAPEQQPA